MAKSLLSALGLRKRRPTLLSLFGKTPKKKEKPMFKKPRTGKIKTRLNRY